MSSSIWVKCAFSNAHRIRVEQPEISRTGTPYVEPLKSKEVGIKQLQEASVFIAQLDQKYNQVAHNVNFHATMNERFCSEADRDPKDDLWKMFSEFVYRHHVVPVNNCVSQKSRPKSVNVHWFREANRNQLG